MKKADVIFILALLLAAASLFLITGRQTGAAAVVSVDGREVARYSLNTDGTYSLNGGTNILLIENGAARMLDADCPDGLCMKMGAVSKTGQSITCLPNRVVVKIIGAEDAEYDVIVG